MTDVINFVDWSTFTEENFNRLKEYWGGKSTFGFHAGGVKFEIYKFVYDHSVLVNCSIPLEKIVPFLLTHQVV